MAGNKEVNSNLEIKGKINLKDVPNNTPTGYLVWNSGIKDIAQRTPAQIIYDLGLITATNIAASYYTKTQVDTNIKTAVDNIQIGGRNLVKYSDLFQGYRNDSGVKASDVYYVTSNDIIKIDNYSNYIVTFKSKTNKNYKCLLLLYVGDLVVFREDVSSGQLINAPLADGVSFIIYESPEYTNPISIEQFKSDVLLQIEKGNKATDWTPAPEDQVSDWITTDVNDFSFLKNKPTKLSQFTNDAGYLTSSALSPYAQTSWVNTNFDKYTAWNLKTNGVQRTTIKSGETLDLVGGDNVSLSYEAGLIGGSITINAADQSYPLFTGPYPGLVPASGWRQTTNSRYLNHIGEWEEIDGLYMKTTHPANTINQNLSTSSIPAFNGANFSGTVNINYPGDAPSHQFLSRENLNRSDIYLTNPTKTSLIRLTSSTAETLISIKDHTYGDMFSVGANSMVGAPFFQLPKGGSRFRVGRFADYLPQYIFISKGDSLFEGTLTANTIIKSGGSATQVLMADGSVKEQSTFEGNHTGLYAPINHSHTFASITDKPTTIAGYGITDSYVKTQVDTNIKTAVNNIQIGGRNLILNSKDIFLSGNDYQNSTNTAGKITVHNNNSYWNGYAFVALSSEPLIGEVLTYSIDLKANADCSIDYSFMPHYGIHNIVKSTNLISGEWKRVFITVTIIGVNGNATLIGMEGVNIPNLIVEYRNPKIEKGNKATDWTPAPEDQVSDWNTTDINDLSFLKNKPTKLSQFTNDSNFLTQETDPTVPAHVKSISAGNINNWNTAYTNNHTHANKVFLDVIDQNLGTTHSPTFNNITVGYVSGTYKGFNSDNPFAFLNANEAQQIYTGGILSSNFYADASKIPTNGIYSKGAVLSVGGFIREGGTETQFLKANGTVDSNTYLTSAALTPYAQTSWVNANFDKYTSWNLQTNSVQRTSMPSGSNLNLVAGANVTISYSAGGTVTINATDTNTTYTLASLGGLPLAGGIMTGVIDLNRSAGSANTGLAWWTGTYKAWRTYMSTVGAGQGPVGITAPTGQLVTTYALRNYIEDTAGYGWTFEAGAAQSTTPTIKAEIRSSDGAARFGSVSVYGGTSSGFLKADGTIDSTGYMSTSHPANAITSTNITNWNTAFGWGNHAGLYSPINHSHTVLNVHSSLTQTVNTPVWNIPIGLTTAFVDGDSGYGSYGSVLNLNTFSASNGGALQLYVPYADNLGGTGLKYRKFNYGGTWGSIKTLWDSGNLTKLSQLSNDVGYLTSSALSPYAQTSWVNANFDKYTAWNLQTNNVQRTSMPSGSNLNLVAGANVTINYSAGGTVTINAANSGVPTNMVTTDTAQTISGVKEFTQPITAKSFYEGSLRSLKKNIKTFEKSGLDLVGDLNIVTFDRKDESVKNKIGIIADDSPKEFLSEELDSVDLYKTVFIQAKAIQELTEEMNNLRELVMTKLNKI